MTAKFIKSSTHYEQCPPANKPEYAFIGRSNVGKSSLINMLVEQKNLAKTSQNPGKTQVINHFEIDESYYWVDLPGYGYAKVSREERAKWEIMIQNYLMHRENLLCVFVLIDSRLKPQQSDLDFIQQLGENQVPFVMVFTKSDKISQPQLQSNVAAFKKEMLNTWEEVPQMFFTSSEKKIGREEILFFVKQTNKTFETFKK